MKLVPYLFGIFFINVTFAAELDVLWLGDNPYASIYNKTNSLLIINTYDKISELEEKYNLAVGREQSYANRMLGAVSIGAGGIGGMMLASGIAEQSADAAAERDMSAYLATFRCDYGAYTSISRALSEPGGEDATEWAAQKSESQQQTQTGGIVGGSGVGIGIIGNVIINGKK